jgi:hypothetical protein
MGREQILFVAKARVIAAGDPLLLHELELAGKAGVWRHEGYSAIDDVQRLCVLAFRGVFRGSGRAIGKTAPRDAAAMNQASFKSEGIAGIHPADVCTQWALDTGEVILGLLEICAAVGICTMLRSTRSGESSTGVPSHQRPMNLEASFSFEKLTGFIGIA